METDRGLCTPPNHIRSRNLEQHKMQTKALNRILDNIIKRILKTPVSTPREPLYMETGMLDVEHQAKKKPIMMKHRIKDTASKLLESTINANTKGGWKARLGELEKTTSLDEEEYNKPKETLKSHISQKNKGSL